MKTEILITANGESGNLIANAGEAVIEVACSNWSGAELTLKRRVGTTGSYVVQNSDGDVTFTENGGVVVPGEGIYFFEVTGYTNPITAIATTF